MNIGKPIKTIYIKRKEGERTLPARIPKEEPIHVPNWPIKREIGVEEVRGR